MTKQYRVHHRIVGYDPNSDLPVWWLAIPNLKLVNKLVQFDAEDPNGYDAYKLSHMQVAKLVGWLQKPTLVRPDLDYFIEPFNPYEHAKSIEISIKRGDTVLKTLRKNYGDDFATELRKDLTLSDILHMLPDPSMINITFDKLDRRKSEKRLPVRRTRRKRA